MKRGMTTRSSPVRSGHSGQLAGPLVQVERVERIACFLVNGRAAVRSRSPAPRSDAVSWTAAGAPWSGMCNQSGLCAQPAIVAKGGTGHRERSPRGLTALSHTVGRREACKPGC
jgi:hypothetical protein